MKLKKLYKKLLKKGFRHLARNKDGMSVVFSEHPEISRHEWCVRDGKIEIILSQKQQRALHRLPWTRWDESLIDLQAALTEIEAEAGKVEGDRFGDLVIWLSSRGYKYIARNYSDKFTGIEWCAYKEPPQAVVRFGKWHTTYMMTDMLILSISDCELLDELFPGVNWMDSLTTILDA